MTRPHHQQTRCSYDSSYGGFGRVYSVFLLPLNVWFWPHTLTFRASGGSSTGYTYGRMFICGDDLPRSIIDAWQEQGKHVLSVFVFCPPCVFRVASGFYTRGDVEKYYTSTRTTIHPIGAFVAYVRAVHCN